VAGTNLDSFFLNQNKSSIKLINHHHDGLINNINTFKSHGREIGGREKRNLLLLG